MTNPQQAGGQWAQQQKEGLERQEESAKKNEARRVAEGGTADRQSQQQQTENRQNDRQGDNRTPDKTIGEVKYAENEKASEQRGQRVSGRAGTPEKQGGIGGP